MENARYEGLPCPPLDLDLRVELEPDGDRWIADIVDLPGVMVYGPTRGEAFCAAQALALEVLADRLKHGEDLRTGLTAKTPVAAPLGGLRFFAA
ncbi:MAG: type II toxin-antitoxin system HicB family antitoxin [Anaerolineales bacterium]